MLHTPPLALYIHFPWCARKCPYCDFNSHTLRTELPEQAYIEALIADLEQDLAQIGDRHLVSIFCGGGTPNLFSESALCRLFTAIIERCRLATDIEISLEANPGIADYERFAAYRAIGINRLSLGVQSFQTVYLQRLGRIHDGQTALQAVEAAKSAGFVNLNLDLMYGLPQQDCQAGLADLIAAIQLEPAHISWYQLTIEANTTFAQRPPVLPSDEAVWALQQQGLAQLNRYGFSQYEISAYHRAGFQCVHNRNYWQFGDYIGIGAGAHSKLTDITQHKIIRCWKQRHPKDYLAQKNNFLGGMQTIAPTELPFEFMLNALRLHQPIALPLFEQRTGLSRAVLNTALAKAEQQGLLTYDQQTIELTDLGKRFYNDLVMLFINGQS